MSDSIIRQKIEVLNGDRGDPNEAAARVKHIRALLSTIPAEPKAVTVSAAPTAAEHNALLEDIRMLYAGINALRTVLR